jgi:hypothetical protein
VLRSKSWLWASRPNVHDGDGQPKKRRDGKRRAQDLTTAFAFSSIDGGHHRLLPLHRAELAPIAKETPAAVGSSSFGASFPIESSL